MQKSIDIFITHILGILIVLSFGCISKNHESIDKNKILVLCQEEYSALSKKGDGKWIPVSFTVMIRAK